MQKIIIFVIKKITDNDLILFLRLDNLKYIRIIIVEMMTDNIIGFISKDNKASIIQINDMIKIFPDNPSL